MIQDYFGIKIDLSKDDILTDFSKTLLKNFYMLDSETSPQESFGRAAIAYSEGDLEFAQRIYNYASDQWFMFSSPTISNAPVPGQEWKTLPISCYLSFVDDSLKSLINHSSELRWLSVKGGGIGGHWSNIRAVSKKAPGPIPFLKTIDADMLAYTQGKTRRASYAAYLDISHPDILEFIDIKMPTGGDPNRKCFNIHPAVNITDDFMIACDNDEDWGLKDPHTGEVRETISARYLLQRLIDVRFKTGEPYFCFIDEANRHLPEQLKNKGLKIHGSNLCNEIMLPTSEERTAVCCLSSVNLEYFDQWKDSQMVEDLIRMLDNVLDIFIANAPDEISKAKFSAERQRDLGLGALGFHSYLQSKMIPFESAVAEAININIFKLINEKAVKTTMELAIEKGAYPDDSTGTRRNAHLIAIAPNANSAIIAGSSFSTEPLKSNAYTHKMRAGSHLVTNKHLDKLIRDKYNDKYDEIWDQIVLDQGSIQNIECFTDYEKDVFKTAFEIDQRWVVNHAAKRQPYVCQGQSVNLFFPIGADRAYVLSVHRKAWKEKLKGLYYLRTSAGVNVEISKKIERVALIDYQNQEECLSCHG